MQETCKRFARDLQENCKRLARVLQETCKRLVDLKRIDRLKNTCWICNPSRALLFCLCSRPAWFEDNFLLRKNMFTALLCFCFYWRQFYFEQKYVLYPFMLLLLLKTILCWAEICPLPFYAFASIKDNFMLSRNLSSSPM